MEFELYFVALLALLAIGASLVGGIMAIIALLKIGPLRQELFDVRRELRILASKAPAQPSAGPRPAEVPHPSPTVAPAEAPRVPQPPVAGPSHAPTSPHAAPRPPVSRSAPPQTPTAPANDNLQGLESRIGQRWIAWVGAVVVFFSAVFFLKYAFDNSWIGPTGQVVICALGGLVMLAAGSRFVTKKWRILGQSLMGLGLGILYATFYAAFSVYAPPVMSQNMAFMFLMAVTIAGMALAILHDALTLAFLAVLGGILTPVLVSTGQDSHNVLFTYLLLLNLGVVAVAFFKRWRLLDTLAMVGTFIMYTGWHAKFYTDELLVPAMCWLAGFYVVFLILPFIYHLVRKQNITLERFLMAIVNAFFFGSYAWFMLHENNLFLMGFISLGMAAEYLVLGALIRRRLPQDTQALFGVIAMTVAFLTLAIPMELQAHGILLAWVIEAPVLVYLAYRFRYLPVRVFAAVVLLIAVGRLFLTTGHWPGYPEHFTLFFNRYFLSAMSVPVAAAAYAFIHHFYRAQGTTLDRILKYVTALSAGVIALIVLHGEIFSWLGLEYAQYDSYGVVTALWALGAISYLIAGIKIPRAAPYVWSVGTLVLVFAGILLLEGFNQTLGKTHLLLLNVRFVAGLLVMLAFFGYAWAIHRSKAVTPEISALFTILYFAAGTVGLLGLLSLEAYSFCTDVIEVSENAHRMGQMSVTLVWSLYAAGLLTLGFWRHWRALRISGLALFGMAALKLVLVDMTDLKGIYRIVSFLVLGLLMLAASYVYNRLEKRLSSTRKNPLPEANTAIGDAQ